MNLKKINNNYLIITLIFFSFLARVLTVYFIRDLEFDYEWGTLINNLSNYQSYTYYTFDNQLVPSVYMPPLYPFFIYFIKIVSSTEGFLLLNIIIFIQILLSTYSVYLFYELCQNFFTKNISFINTLFFSFFPLNLYITGQISAANFQIVFSLLFLKFLFSIMQKNSFKNILIFSAISGLLMLTRGEFILIFLIITTFIFFKKKIKVKDLIKICLIVTLIISPYVARNYYHFNQYFIVKSFGWNLWKGNNELSQVEGYEYLLDKNFSKLYSDLKQIKRDKYYEINRDGFFLNKAITNIKEDPKRYIILVSKKFVSYFFIDINSSYPNYYNLFHIVPILILSLLAFPGLFVFYRQNKFQNNSLILYLLCNLVIFSIFFILPRYKLIILPIQIILAASFLNYILKKIKKKSKGNI